MANWEQAQALLASAARTTTGNGAAVDLGTRDRLLRQTLSVTAASGTTPTLDVRLEASADGVTGWRSFATFTRATAATVERITAISPDRYVRVAWTIAGTTPSFTFDASGTRGVSYANLDHLDTLGLPVAALSSRTASQRAEAIAVASEKIDSKLGVVFDLPLVAWGADITECVCKIAGYDLLSVRGFNPDGADQNIRDRQNDAWRWLADVANLKAVPVGIVDSTADVDDAGIAVVSSPSRGWR